MKKITTNKAPKVTPAVQVVLADGRQFFFSTLKAIYERLNPVDVGVGYWSLSQQHLKVGETYRTEQATISKIQIFGQRHKPR